MTSKTERVLPARPYSRGCLGSFQQQRLTSCFVIYSPIPVALALFSVALVCIPIGVMEIVYTGRAKSVDHRYDNINNYKFQSSDSLVYPHVFSFNGTEHSMGTRTFVSFELTQTLMAPVLLMYSLKDFHQNFRSFVSSIDPQQLYGKTSKIITDCKPFQRPGELQGKKQSGYYSPCGSIAWSMFNDTFALYKLSSKNFDGSTVPSDATLICDGSQFDKNGDSLLASNQCTKKGIALPSSTYSYKEPATETDNSGPIWMFGGDSSASDPFLKEGYYYGEPGHVIPSTVDEDFIVWSEPALLPDFQNIYRIINTDLAAGDYLFDITELFSFPGEKHVVLATRNWLGSKHLVLGILTVVLGAFSMISAFFVIFLRYPFTTQ